MWSAPLNWVKRRRMADVVTHPPIGTLRKFTKVLVVDDEEDSFPTKALRDDGYTIEWWPQVDGRGLQRMENGEFDIVILDIQGVTPPALSDTGDALGVLRRIKDVNPAQVVVAFSSQSYDLGSVPFWKLADDAMRKPVSIVQCKEVLDRLIGEHITAAGYWNTTVRLLEARHVPEKRIRALEREVVKTIGRRGTISLEVFNNAVGTIDNVQTVFGWVLKIIALCTLMS